MRKYDYAFLTYTLAMLQPPSDFFLNTSAQRVLAYVHSPQDLRGYWNKVHQILAIVIFSSTALTQ